MQLLICPGWHRPELTQRFVQALLTVAAPEKLWQLPPYPSLEGLSWLLHQANAPRQQQPLTVIGFSAGVVAAYPLLLGWHQRGGDGSLIAVDGWGMPLVGLPSVYRLSHDLWTHRTSYFPSPAEGQGDFYAQPPVSHLDFWASPQQATGQGRLGCDAPRPMTALEFIAQVLSQEQCR